jgi:hypothetical protein
MDDSRPVHAHWSRGVLTIHIGDGVMLRQKLCPACVYCGGPTRDRGLTACPALCGACAERMVRTWWMHGRRIYRWEVPL